MNLNSNLGIVVRCCYIPGHLLAWLSDGSSRLSRIHVFSGRITKMGTILKLQNLNSSMLSDLWRFADSGGGGGFTPHV